MEGDGILYNRIRCLNCNRVSYNPNDIRERYCGYCYVFHEERQQQEQFARVVAMLGKLVTFAHQPPGVAPARVLSCDRYGMVELEGWPGRYAAYLLMASECVETE